MNVEGSELLFFVLVDAFIQAMELSYIRKPHNDIEGESV